MNLLALDASSDACSVAVQAGDDILLNHQVAPQQHAALLLPTIERLMSEAGLAPGDLDGIAYGRGPGSFTGVRIGIAVTQGIALGADIGVIGVSSLAAIAQGCQREFQDTAVLAALDARMGEVYFAAYRCDDNSLMQLVGSEVAVAPDRILITPDVDAVSVSAGKIAIPLQANTHWHLAGSGAQRYIELMSAMGGSESLPLRSDRWPSAEDVLTLAVVSVVEGKLQPAEAAVPVYLRDRVALTTVERAAVKRLG
ncbi:MAG: tRNA (adenosine(37)-N6)-threonylcarbamoyltransferase complex dimerization subunit type 1 TsaB [Granulosicoccus sp.]